MKVVIDTSSLLSMVRYYLPFDKEGKLKSFLEDRILSGEIVVLENVVEECKFQGRGQIVAAFPFLDKSRYKTSMTNVPINRKLYNMIDNNFINGSVRARFGEAEYESERNKYIASADFAMILYAYSIKESDNVVIVTEETGYSNDGKPFKKIPDICQSIGISTMNFPTLLSENDTISLSIDVVKTTLF